MNGFLLLAAGMIAFAAVAPGVFRAEAASGKRGTISSVLLAAYLAFLLWLFGHYMLGVSFWGSRYGMFVCVFSALCGLAHSFYADDQNDTGHLFFGLAVGFFGGAAFMLLTVADK